ncbi:TetR/AcrR family transcriptional regulator [Motiliproteus coralliicola]|uniref:TetR/AcrR family transcriptional regulator n=1 Tax=Motiliproteus coralliicola TaxID=2283196 RepID=A0A369X098_9GAMM|nr:TetR/AcrR family transcriptional regulator [Motiliproteus coralliicola]RDE25195.1 TetR/AcrR family transcriptional regulator [Motiliproteus coralliicola]
MSKVEQNKQRKREAILTAAQNVFLSEGYVLAGMDRIAAQAQVTKQTVYRYYPSKIELFKATLLKMGQENGFDFADQLQQSDSRQALYDFAKGFIKAHLSEQHLATFRLLVAESAKAPELTRSFCDIGPDHTADKLSEFFRQRFELKDPEASVQLWTAMLLAQRAGVLIGMDKPSEAQIEQHAKRATDMLLASIG